MTTDRRLSVFVDTRPPHPVDHGEPRGPGVRFVGLCVYCRQATIRFDKFDKRPAHSDCAALGRASRYRLTEDEPW